MCMYLYVWLGRLSIIYDIILTVFAALYRVLLSLIFRIEFQNILYHKYSSEITDIISGWYLYGISETIHSKCLIYLPICQAKTDRERQTDRQTLGLIHRTLNWWRMLSLYDRILLPRRDIWWIDWLIDPLIATRIPSTSTHHHPPTYISLDSKTSTSKDRDRGRET